VPPRCANIRGRGQTNKESNINHYKTCITCKRSQLASEFCKCSRSKDLLNAKCKSCAKKYYERNRNKILAQKSVYYQANYERIATYKNNYYKDNKDKLLKQKRAAYSSDPKETQARNNAWARNNRDKINQYYRKYVVDKPHVIRQKRIKRRLRMLTNGVFEVRKSELNRLLTSPCVFCGNSANITLDHVLPIARGGRHSIGNLMPLCLSCNASKQDKTFMEFRMSKILQAEMRL